MASCTRIKPKKRMICLGDLRDIIKINLNKIRPSDVDGVDDYDLDSELTITVPAMKQTTRGTQFFDGTQLINGVTHKFYTRFIPNLEIVNWIEFQGKKYDILDTENLDEDNKFLLFSCAVKGDITKKANTGNFGREL